MSSTAAPLPLGPATNAWQFPSQGYHDSSVRLPSQQTLASNCRCHHCRCNPPPPPHPLLLAFDAHMGFRFRCACNVRHTTFHVVPLPSTSPLLLRNERAWLGTKSLILSKDAHRADRGGLPSLLSWLMLSAPASSRSAAIRSLSDSQLGHAALLHLHSPLLSSSFLCALVHAHPLLWLIVVCCRRLSSATDAVKVKE